MHLPESRRAGETGRESSRALFGGLVGQACLVEVHGPCTISGVLVVGKKKIKGSIHSNINHRP